MHRWVGELSPEPRRFLARQNKPFPSACDRVFTPIHIPILSYLDDTTDTQTFTAYVSSPLSFHLYLRRMIEMVEIAPCGSVSSRAETFTSATTFTA